MSTPVDAVHVATSLNRLHIRDDQSIALPETRGDSSPGVVQRTPREGYGFRNSGVSTPAPANGSPPTSQLTAESLVPDPNGLGWPGQSRSYVDNLNV